MSDRKTVLNVDLANVLSNLNVYRKETNKQVFTVVKANSYGLGSLELSKLFEANNSPYLCTATLDEAIYLRKNNIKCPILIMGYVHLENLEIAKKYDLTITVVSSDYAKQIKVKDLKVHLKVNTSMNRLGHDTLEQLRESINALQHITQIEGIFTHYYSNDLENITKDFNTFKNITEALQFDFKYIHAASSNSSLIFKENFTNAVRVGIGLYGGITNYNLKNVVSLISEVVNIRKVNKDCSVSYASNYKTKEETFIATIPIGYADGLLRSDTGSNVFINNKYYKIIGSICMDQIMVEVDENVTQFDEVELFGHNISLQDVAVRRDTISYEVLTSVANRVEKVYKK